MDLNALGYLRMNDDFRILLHQLGTYIYIYKSLNRKYTVVIVLETAQSAVNTAKSKMVDITSTSQYIYTSHKYM